MPTATPKVCAVCQSEQAQPGRKFCGPDCKRIALSRYRRARVEELGPEIVTCVHCGGLFTYIRRSTGRAAQYCSRECRYLAEKARGTHYYPRCAIRVSTCEVCGQMWSGRRGNKPARTCKDRRCVLEMRARIARERYAADPEKHRSRVATARANLTDEQRAAERKRWQSWVASRGGRAAVGRASDLVRRARKAGVDAESFDSLEVYERDGWTCGICDVEIDPQLKHPDPMSVSLDHVIPLSLGGPHTRANTRPAHLQCNIRRGNRVESESLAS